MAQLTDQQQELLQVSDDLYARFGTSLEPHHNGQFIAISPDGGTVHGPDRFLVLEEAAKRFGKDNFIFRKIGSAALGKWRRSVAR